MCSQGSALLRDNLYSSVSLGPLDRPLILPFCVLSVIERPRNESTYGCIALCELCTGRMISRFWAATQSSCPPLLSNASQALEPGCPSSDERLFSETRGRRWRIAAWSWSCDSGLGGSKAANKIVDLGDATIVDLHVIADCRSCYSVRSLDELDISLPCRYVSCIAHQTMIYGEATTSIVRRRHSADLHQ